MKCSIQMLQNLSNFWSMKNLHSAYSCFSFRANIIIYSLMNSLVYDNRKSKVAGSPLKVFGVALKMKEQCDVSLILGKVGGSQTLFSPSFCVSCHLLPNYRICVKIPPLSNQLGMYPIIATRIPNNFRDFFSALLSSCATEQKMRQIYCYFVSRLLTQE